MAGVVNTAKINRDHDDPQPCVTSLDLFVNCMSSQMRVVLLFLKSFGMSLKVLFSGVP